MKSVAVAAVLLFATSSAGAQPGTEPRSSPYAPVAPYETVDENIAIGLSLGGTALSWGLLLAGASSERETLTMVGAVGTLVAPSLGHWYSHSFLTRGLGLRMVGLAAAVTGLMIAVGDSLDFDGESENDDTINTLLLLGAGMYIAGTVDDIAMAPRAAQRYNARFENVTIVPRVSANGAGLALVGRF